MTRILPESLVLELRAEHGWAKETIRAIESAVLQALQVAAPGEPDAWIAQNGNTFDVSVKRPTEMGGYAQLDWQPLYRATPLHREPASSDSPQGASRQEAQLPTAEGEREAFEAAMRANAGDAVELGGAMWGRGWMYGNRLTQCRWEGWQARAALTRSPSAPAVQGSSEPGEPTDTQRDAERWQWLRGKEFASGGDEEADFRWAHCFESADDLDAAIDAALSAGSQKQDGGQG
jgi:hypothetical protein